MPTDANQRQKQLIRRLDSGIGHLWVANVFANFVNVGCSFVHPMGYWMPLNSMSDGSVLDFHIGRGGADQREAHNALLCSTVKRTLRPFEAALGAYVDVAVPVHVGKNYLGALVSGPLLRRRPTAAEIRAEWRELTGHRARPLDRLLVSYAQAVFRTQVLTDEERAAYTEFLGLVAQLFSGSGDLSVVRQGIRRLIDKRLSKIPSARLSKAEHFLDPTRSHVYDVGLRSFEVRELGIEQPPNVAIAVAPRYPDNARSHDTIEQLVLADQLQTASVRFAQQLPDTLTARLADTGILVLCHVNPKTTRARRRAIVRERAEAASLFLRREFGCGACIGAGRLVERPQSLHRSAEQALVAMQIAVHRGIELVFHEDQLAPEREQTLMPVPRATARLLTEYERGTAERLDAAFSELVRTALDQAAGRPSVARAHFEHALSALLERVQRRAQLDARAYAELEQRVAEALGRAQTGTELILAVRDCFDALQRATERPEDEQRELRLGRAAGYIKDHCHQPIDLAEAARQAGLSRTYFSRAFKSAFGVGFGRYLQDRRLERARELLQATTIAIGRVSQESGFVSVTHFAVAFKRAHGVTPLEYRRRMQERAAQRD